MSNAPNPEKQKQTQKPTLPVELILLILHHSPTPTYLNITFSSRRLYEIGSSSREVVLHHLRQLPLPVHQHHDQLQDQPDGEARTEASGLFNELVRRAERALLGAERGASCRRYYFGSGFEDMDTDTDKNGVGCGIDALASSVCRSRSGRPEIKSGSGLGSVEEKVALVARGDSRVNVYTVDSGNGRLTHVRRLDPPWTATGPTTTTTELEPEAEVEVIRTCFNTDADDLYVLYRVKPTIVIDTPLKTATGVTDAHPFVAEALCSSPRWETYLVRYALDGLRRVNAAVCGFPEHLGYEPVALGVGAYYNVADFSEGSENEDGDGDRCVLAVSWRGACAEEDEVVLYSVSREKVKYEKRVAELDYESFSIIHGSATDDDDESRRRVDPGSVVDIAFNRCNRDILFYSKGQSIFGSLQPISPDSPWYGLQTNRQVAWFSSIYISFILDVPFFGMHQNCSPDGPGRRRYLTLGTATHRGEGWSVACLLVTQTSCHTAACGHVLNVEDGMFLDHWRAVARLWGFPRPVSTLGCSIAASRRGTRIAVANWKTLYVWAVEPEALVGDNADKIYPRSWWSRKCDMVELRPVVLQLHAVCFKLHFLEENELLALTDRGLMYWDLSPGGRGERTSHQLNLI